jgi:hypothetical protein
MTTVGNRKAYTLMPESSSLLATATGVALDAGMAQAANRTAPPSRLLVDNRIYRKG